MYSALNSCSRKLSLLSSPLSSKAVSIGSLLDNAIRLGDERALYEFILDRECRRLSSYLQWKRNVSRGGFALTSKSPREESWYSVGQVEILAELTGGGGRVCWAKRNLHQVQRADHQEPESLKNCMNKRSIFRPTENEHSHYSRSALRGGPGTCIPGQEVF